MKKLTSDKGMVGAKLCFLLIMLGRRLSIFFFLQHIKECQILEQQLLKIIKNITEQNIIKDPKCFKYYTKKTYG
jgi:hypothetical protein